MDNLRADELFGCTTADGEISIIGGITTRLVREIAARHEMVSVAAVAAGRLVTGAALIGASLRGEERVSLQIVSDGPLQSIAAEVRLLDDDTVGARAYTQQPRVQLERNAVGSLDVRHAVGKGHLRVTKSFQIGQPFSGIVALRTGEIDDDIAAYFTQSQQIPGIVALGVLEADDELLAAGGIIAQVMPSADESVFAELERRSKVVPDINHFLREGATAADLVRAFLGDETPIRSERSFAVSFHCHCTRDRVELALMSLGAQDLLNLAQEQPVTEAICEFCRHVYQLSAAEVRELADRIASQSDVIE